MSDQPIIPLPVWARNVVMVIVFAAVIGVFGWHFVEHAFAQKLVAAPCPTTGQSHTIVFSHGVLVPATLTVRRCDQVTVKNNDQAIYEPALGPHEHHVHYPTFSEEALGPNKSITFQAGVAGTFELHDHLRDKALSTIVITP